MTRIVSVVSGKGGAGKTTLVANLGASLAKMGYDVVVVDANLTTPNLGMHLGAHLFPTGFHDVLKGRATIDEATYQHESGLRIIPAGIGINDLKGADARDIPGALLDLIGKTDIILIDAAAGLGREALAAIEASDELIIITNPDLPSVTDALKAVKLAEELGTKIIGVVLNRIKRKKYEMKKSDISAMLDNIPIIAEIPEDELVQEAISVRTPVVQHRPNAFVSQKIKKLAANVVGEDIEVSKPWYQRLFNFFVQE
ncbi:MAG: septum site-determining protein MinD [Candidatus Aenigmarchaeota archaeon ex4484_14]|nr:MAG: septum site-determining protein MinD [Candidatus Aenigmarchaeota archaeon ex4484_14]